MSRLRLAWTCCAVWAGISALEVIGHDPITIVTGAIACVFAAFLAVAE